MFAYLKVPRSDQQCGNDAKRYIEKNGLNQTHDAIVCYQDGPCLAVILLEEREEDISQSLNAYMVAEGLAVLPNCVQDEGDEDVKEWLTF